MSYFADERKPGIADTSMFDSAPKVPEMPALLSQLEKEIYRLDEEAKSLAARLSPFMVPDAPVPVDPRGNLETTARPQHSDFYNHLDSMRLRLGAVSDMLSYLKDHLEI